MLLSHTVQPPLISLFSSSSSHPLLLSTALTVPSSNSPESFISLLSDSTDTHETLLAWGGGAGGAKDLETRLGSLKAQRRAGGTEEGERRMKELRGRVLHLQAPDCRTTSVRWGSMGGTGIAKEEEKALGVELPLLRMQVKDLGQMCYVDVAARTKEGETVVLRASNWQPAPEYLPATTSTPALLHLPLLFPSTSSSVAPLLTHWTLLTLPLSTLLLSLSPPLTFQCVLGVEVHATMRVKRVWFEAHEDGGGGGGGGAGGETTEEMARKGRRVELGMYAAEMEMVEGGGDEEG